MGFETGIVEFAGGDAMFMMEKLFQRESVPVLETALSFAHQRHQTIMNNIANVETPYYKRQSVPESEFMASLSEALAERKTNHPCEFVMKDSMNIDYSKGGYIPQAQIGPGKEFGPERHDENSVVIEKEMGDLAKNTIYIDTLQRLLKKKYTMFRAAARGSVG